MSCANWRGANHSLMRHVQTLQKPLSKRRQKIRNRHGKTSKTWTWFLARSCVFSLSGHFSERKLRTERRNTRAAKLHTWKSSGGGGMVSSEKKSNVLEVWELRLPSEQWEGVKKGLIDQKITVPHKKAFLSLILLHTKGSWNNRKYAGKWFVNSLAQFLVNFLLDLNSRFLNHFQQQICIRPKFWGARGLLAVQKYRKIRLWSYRLGR